MTAPAVLRSRRGASDSDVFVSYSREDAAFVGRLAKALEERGRSPWLDVEGIEDGEVFPEVLREAIERTDAFVFVISPASAASAFCRQEVEHAIACGKRIVPVVHRPVADEDLPAGVRERQWVRIGTRLRPEAADRLVSALDADPVHTRRHTRVLVRAREWAASGRADSLLPRGEELVQAEQWLAQALGRDPAPTELQGEWIARGRRNATTRQRRLLTGATALTLVAVLSLVVALFGRNAAVDARATERSRALAAQADAQLGNDPQLSLLLARRALDVKATPEAVLATSRALDANTARGELPGLGAQSCIDAMRMVPLPASEVAVTTCDGRLVRQDLDRRTILDTVEVGDKAGPVALAGDQLVVGTDKGLVLVDPRTWAVTRRIPTPYPLVAVAVDPTGRRVAAAARDRVVVLSLVDPTVRRDFPLTNGGVDQLFNVAWTGPDTLLVGGADAPPLTAALGGGAATLDLVTGQASALRLDRSAPSADRTVVVEGLVVSPDRSSWFFTGIAGPSDGSDLLRARTWRVAAGTRAVTWSATGPDAQFGVTATLSDDGGSLLVGYGNGLAALLDSGTGGELLRFPGHSTAVRSVLLRGGGEPVVTASQDGVVRTWAGTGTERAQRSVGAGTFAVVGREDGFVPFGTGTASPLLDAGDGHVVRQLPAVPEDAVGFAFSGRGQTAATLLPAGSGTRLTVTDLATGRPVGRPFDPQGSDAYGVAADGRVVLVDKSDSGTVRPSVVDPVSGRRTQLAEGPQLCTTAGGEFSPDQRRVAISDDCGTVVVYDLASGQVLQSVRLQDRSTVNGPVWSPDSRRVFLGVAGGSLVVVDTTTGRVQQRPGSQAVASAVAASPDGRFVALVGSGGVLDVYDAQTLRLVRQHRLPTAGTGLAMTATSLAVLDARGVLRVWDTCGDCQDPVALAARAKAQSVRELTAGERATYVD